MRYVVYLLLVANAVYFTWNLLSDSPGPRLARRLPPIPESVRTLVTLRELREASKQPADKSEVEAITQLEPPGAGPALGCQTLGPFLAAADLQQAANELDSRGLAAQSYENEESVEVGYWIYLPPMEWETARKITGMLDEKGDKEYYIGKENLIALGAFDTMTRAKTRLEKVRKYGLEPLLEPRYKTRTVHWLELKTAGNDRKDMAAILEEYPDIRLQDAACRSIATEEAIN
jgi:hypothetical protein